MATKKAPKSIALKKALKLAEKNKATAKRKKAVAKGQLTKEIKKDIEKVSSWKVGMGQSYPQSNVWTEKADKELVAKPVGFRWTDEGAKKAGKSADSRPTASDVEKYSGKTFRIPNKPNPASEDGSYRYIYQEKRVDKSDVSKKAKFEQGGGVSKKTYASLYADIVKSVMKDIKVSKEKAESIVDENETLLTDMIEAQQETDVKYLADVITTTDEGKYAKGGGVGDTHEMAHGGKSDDMVVYKGVRISKLHPSGYFEYYSDAQERFLKFSDLDDAKNEIDREMTMGDAYSDYMYNRAFKKGGYNSGLSWKLDRARHNKSERWEKPFGERKSKYAKGGGLQKEINKDLDKLYKEDVKEEREAKPYVSELEKLFRADQRKERQVAKKRTEKAITTQLESLYQADVVDRRARAKDMKYYNKSEDWEKEYSSRTGKKRPVYNKAHGGEVDDEISDEYKIGGKLRQSPPQRPSYRVSGDKTVKAKPVGYRFTDSRADKLGVSPYKRPTIAQIEKYQGKGVYFEKRKDKSDLSLSKKLEDGGEMARGGSTAKRVGNFESRIYSENRLDFIGNNLEGKNLDNGDYVVLSYKWYPIWFYSKREKQWYGNKDKYSVSTSKHMSQSRPTHDATMLSKSQLSDKMMESSNYYTAEDGAEVSE
jgi:hypothetical protein